MNDANDDSPWPRRPRPFQPYRFPPLGQSAPSPGAPSEAQAIADWQQALARGFEQGHHDGHASGLTEGRADGLEQGRRQGHAEGHADGRDSALRGLEQLGAPLDKMLTSLRQLRRDYRAAQRGEVVELVARVARQVIRAELALQPVQLLALVDETLAALPPARETIEVFLNPEELKRIRELDPKRARRWNLIADPRLDAGECRIRAGDNEVDAGCRQRLASCLEQTREHLNGAAGAAADADDAGAAP
jgi:flagellar assembly protein FliH